ncbi:MAG: DUF2318 domain-containing protein [Clostridia bacterium]|nr:DUF2318 domain-containing protein [Clostridia bacterium]
MLKYLYSVTEDLLITVTLITLVWAALERTYGKKAAGYLWSGIGVGTVISAWLTYERLDVFRARRLNTWLNVNQQEIYLTTGIVCGSVLMLLALAIWGRKDGHELKTGGVIPCILGAATVCALAAYELPRTMNGPFSFDTMGKGTLSQEWFLRLGGWLLALLLLALYSRYLFRAAVQLKQRGLMIAILAVCLLINDGRVLAIILRYWASSIKRIPWPVRYSRERFPWVSDVTTFASSHTVLFSAVIAGLAMLLPICLFADHVRVTQPYDNPAQLRRHRFNNRKLRRLAAKTVVCFGVFLVLMTAVKAYATRKVELSPPETYTVTEDRILVNLENVSDGHLHRFEYRTENNIAVRWIVIKKPNSGAYGVGLDACDVCGNAGYYERGSQVVCKRCDVVMNIRTIGFKGGCNPIPLDYTIEDGKMVFQLEDIIAGESEFRF